MANPYNKKSKFLKPEKQYIRVGIDYFKIIEKEDRFGIVRTELKKWNKDTLESDFYKGFAKNIDKYDDFTVVPDNKNFQPVVNDCYNFYKKFSHKAIEGDWKWTKILLEHIFAEQFDLGIKYMQLLYLFPKQQLPILALISQQRQTGKSTFIDYVSVLFGANFVLINPHDLTSDFNGIYATSNIIAVEEAVVEKGQIMEKLKTLSTQKNISTNMKMVQNFMIPFFGKIIMASNNEDKFIRIDEDEIRFWVRKINKPTHENHNILNDCIKEIPAFLHYLESIDLPEMNLSRMIFTSKEVETDSLIKIKCASKPRLYQEMVEHFTDYFNNTMSSCNEVYAIPKDIKLKFFFNDHSIDSTYIKDILINHFKFERPEKNISYKPFDEMTFKTGRPFVIKKAYFLDETDKNDEEKEPKKRIFSPKNDQKEPFFNDNLETPQLSDNDEKYIQSNDYQPIITDLIPF